MLKDFFALELYTFFVPLLFGYVKAGLYKKAKINFKIYNVTDWAANNCHTNCHCPISKEVKATTR